MAQSRRVSFAPCPMPSAKETLEAARAAERESPRADKVKSLPLDESKGSSDAALPKEGQPLHTKFNDEGVLEPFLTTIQKDSCKAGLKLLLHKLEGGAGKKCVEEEFAMLESDRRALGNKTFQVARMNVNVMKNRYRNILPYDDTRVVLQVQQGSSGDRTDYINACHIKDAAVGGIPEYIAAQAPLNHTVLDFWEMVFQQRCPAIVMLHAEDPRNGKPYFPSKVDEHLVYGRLRITNQGVLQNNESPVVMRFFLVQDIMNKDDEQHVVHYEYLKWPDLGVPSSTTGVRELLRNLYNFPKNVGPFVVHCRAGIGRTGTFITIMDTIYRILNGDFSALDLRKTVANLRKQRLGLVETLAQYEFCYRTVVEELQELSCNDYLSWRKHNVVKGSYHIPWPQRTSNITTL